MSVEYRCVDVELREDDERRGPGRLVGTLLRYGERAHDRPELFEDGALTWPEGGVVLRRQHARTAPIMRVEPEVRDGAVVLDVLLPDTAAGRDAAAEIRTGLLPGLSVEFKSTSERQSGGVRRIAAAVLTGAGLVDSPAFTSSRVEVRGRRRRLWL